MKDYTNALVAFRRGLSNPSEQFYCKFNLGITLFKLGLFQEALLEYEALEKSHPQNQFVLFNKAVCDLQCGKYHSGVECLDRCLEILMK